jgi:peptidoglycan/xylan/chitin deacetylase (PgdA/CDA1 family)
VNPRPRKLHFLRWLPKRLLTTRVPRAGRRLYLSFDDGPHPEFTPKVLDLLAAHGARASFFLVGARAERHPELVARIVADGHLLGNHSYDHPVFNRLAPAEQHAQVERTDKILAAFDGCDEHAFRPPSGVLTLALLADFARRGRSIAYWSFDSLDYRRLPAAELAEILRATPPSGGDIVLMHDDSDVMIALLETMLPEWREQGFALEALPQHEA